MSLDKHSNKPVMVLFVDKYNNVEYFNYTGDLSLNTYTIGNEAFGKHLFKRLIIRGKDLEDLVDKTPSGTECIDHMATGSRTLYIDYYAHPNSVMGVLLYEFSEKNRIISKDNRNYVSQLRAIRNDDRGERDSRLKSQRETFNSLEKLEKNLKSLKLSFAEVNTENEKLKEELYDLRNKDCKVFSLKFLVLFLFALFCGLFLII